jgi:hypothetical protein
MTAIRKLAAPSFKVVYARVDEEHVVARERRTDLGERPTMKVVPVGRAGMWSNKVTEPNLAGVLAKATAYGDAEGWRIFVYPSSEKDPLGRARREVVANAPVMPPGTR